MKARDGPYKVYLLHVEVVVSLRYLLSALCCVILKKKEELIIYV